MEGKLKKIKVEDLELIKYKLSKAKTFLLNSEWWDTLDELEESIEMLGEWLE